MREIDGAECVWAVGAELGEGPVWRASERAVWFVDIKGMRIHRLSAATGQTRTWVAPQEIGFALPCADGRWIAGLQGGPHLFDPATGAFSPLPQPDGHAWGYRLNDGHVDAEGRLWFGTMDNAEQARGGRLYKLGPDGRSVACDDGYTIANGPCVSPDGRTLYHTDTLDRVIYAFDLRSDGALANKRPFVNVTRKGAYPDGPCVDAEGCVWTGLFGGWGLERYSPKGELLAYVRLPVANVTKAAFGGPDLKTLYVTTAKLHLDEAQRREQPLAGGLFRIDLDVPGLPQYEIAPPAFSDCAGA